MWVIRTGVSNFTSGARRGYSEMTPGQTASQEKFCTSNSVEYLIIHTD
jgi:hypothetical protein